MVESRGPAVANDGEGASGVGAKGASGAKVAVGAHVRPLLRDVYEEQLSVGQLGEALARRSLGPSMLFAGFGAAAGVVFQWLYGDPSSFRPLAGLSYVALALIGGWWTYRPPRFAQLLATLVSGFLITMVATFVLRTGNTSSLLLMALFWLANTFFVSNRWLLGAFGVYLLGWYALVLSRIDFAASVMLVSTFNLLFVGGVGLHFGRRAMLREIVRARQQLVEANRMALHAREQLAETDRAESLRQMARGIAHDFNNLLTGIVGGVDLIELSPEESTRQDALRTIRRAADVASGLCQQIMQIAGGQPLALQPLAASDLLEECAALCRTNAPERAVEVVRTDRSLVLEADPHRVHQLLLNLVNNALEAAPPSADPVRLGAVAANDGDSVTLFVEDQGPGIDQALRERLFDPFVSDKGPGRGLGLAVVASVARDHDATLAVRDLAPGARFEVTFKASRDARPEPVTAQEPVPAISRNRALVVLLVDDDERVRTTTERMLESLGVTSVACGSGRDALAVAADRSQPIDLALVDATMPGMDGYETIRELRKLHPGLPVVLASGHTDLGTGGDTFDAFLPKPFRRTQLAAALAAASGIPDLVAG